MFQITLISSFGMFQLCCKFFLKTFFRKLLKCGTIFVQARGSCHLPWFRTRIISMMKAGRSVESPAAGSKKGAFMRSGWCKNTGELILFLAKKWILDVLTQKYGSPLHFRQKKKSTLSNATGGGGEGGGKGRNHDIIISHNILFLCHMRKRQPLECCRMLQ